MTSIQTSALVFGIVIASFAPQLEAQKSGRKTKPPKEVFGERGMAILSEATRVEVFVVKNEKATEGTEKTIDGFAITDSGKELGRDFAKRLAAVLLDDRAYWLRLKQPDAVNPHVAFRLWKGKESVEVLADGLIAISVAVKDAEGEVVRRTIEHINTGRPMAWEFNAFARESFRKKHLGERDASFLANASRVEVFRIKDAAFFARPDPQIRAYREVTAGNEQRKEFAASLATILLDDKTYSDFGQWNCLPDPGVAFRVWSGKISVEAVLCFRCDIFELNVIDAEGTLIYSAQENFGPVRAAFLKLAKQAFPNDRAIQNLKEQRYE